MASEVEPPHSASKVLPRMASSNPKARVRRELPMTRVRRIHLDSVHRRDHLAIAVTSLAKQSGDFPMLMSYTDYVLPIREEAYPGRQLRNGEVRFGRCD